MPMIRKHVMKFVVQWDQYFHGILRAYRNTPHSSTGEKPSYLLFGYDCHFPTEAALLPEKQISPTNVSDYPEELTLCMSSARDLAMKASQEAQHHYKEQYEKVAAPSTFQIGDWVLVHFAHQETGKMRKLSQPWHGPYRIRDDPDIMEKEVHFPDDPQIQVHQSRVQPCPSSFPQGFFWYRKKRCGAGRPPKWINRRLQYIKNTLRTTTTGVEMPITSMNENQEQNEGAPRKQEKQKKSKQPARTHYNLRSQTNG